MMKMSNAIEKRVKALEDELKRSMEPQSSFSVLFIDPDGNPMKKDGYWIDGADVVFTVQFVRPKARPAEPDAIAC